MVHLILVNGDGRVAAKLEFNTSRELDREYVSLLWPELAEILDFENPQITKHQDGEHTVYAGPSEVELINCIISANRQDVRKSAVKVDPGFMSDKDYNAVLEAQLFIGNLPSNRFNDIEREKIAKQHEALRQVLLEGHESLGDAFNARAARRKGD